MTLPVAVHPMTTRFTTRRCKDGLNLLAPDDPMVARIYTYFLAHYVKRYGLLFHGGVAMSNHDHLCLTDVHAVWGDFKRDFRAAVAKAVNSWRGRSGAMWDASDPVSDIECDTYAQALASAVYTHANPTRAGLVERHTQWPGFGSHATLRLYEDRVIERPPIAFFGPNTKFPETVTLRVVPPPSAPSAEAYRRDLMVGVRSVERVERARRMWRRVQSGDEHSSVPLFLGAKAIRRIPWTTPPKDAKKRTFRALCPRFRGTKAEIKAKAEAFHEFVRAYQAAYDAFREGARDVVFPAGTFAMRRRYGLAVAPRPT